MRNLKIVLLILAAGFLLAAIFGISSCQTISSIVQEPKVSVKTVDLEHISINGIDMICRLNVENPNGFDIPFPEINWQLFINTNSFINGTIKNDTRLARNNTVTVDVPFSVTYSGLFNTFTSLYENMEAAYQIALGIRFPLPLLSDKTYNLDFSGNIPLLQVPKIQSASYNTGRISLTGIEQDWTFVIDNPNVFPIPFPLMNWEYSVNDVPVVKSSLNANGQIAALSQVPVTISAGMDYADLIAVLGSLGSSSQLQSMMNMNTSLPVPSLENLFSGDFRMPAIIPVFQKPELKFRGISIKNLGLQRLEFQAAWEIENKNDFPLNIGDFNYDLSVNNSSWAQGTFAPQQIRANAVTIIPLDIAISSISLITQIVDIINRGSAVNFTSKGSFNLSGDLPGLDRIDLPFDLSGITQLVR